MKLKSNKMTIFCTLYSNMYFGMKEVKKVIKTY